MLVFVPRAYLNHRFATHVTLRIKNGAWATIEENSSPPPNAKKLNGTLYPTLINTHSHAFQRVFAGIAETRLNAQDDFWSWRVKMYEAALSLSPRALYSVALKLYKQLVKGGYGHICEFHYLHHQPSGAAYANPFLLGETLVEAAQKAGLGISILPVLYERAGFSQPALQHDQRRFKTDAEWVLAAAKHFQNGLAFHSLRAVNEGSLTSVLQAFNDDLPIHIHVSEQTKEVSECLMLHGKRPIEWLVDKGFLDSRWQLVHATHTTTQEVEGVAKAGAGIVLCPATEANLGDGLCDMQGFIAANIPLSIGSDSHISRDFRDELRLLEYGQRLFKRQRTVLASQETPSNGEFLFKTMLKGGKKAAGLDKWGLEIGAPAKAMLLSETLDEAIFSFPPKRMKVLNF